MTVWRAGVDIGGTFTDVALIGDGEQLVVTKHLTTHDDPVTGVLSALRDATARVGVGIDALDRVVHATTLATNLVLERKGAVVGQVATAGFGDLLVIGSDRRTHEQRYDLFYQKPAPLVPSSRTVEIDERIGAGGEVVRPLDEAQATQALKLLLEHHEIDALAVCLLHSYANPAHEARVAEIARGLRPGLHVATSSTVWPEYREYARATTTAIAAYVGPVVTDYLARLERSLADAGFGGSLQIMQSNGGVQSAAATAARPVGIIESGPAAGVISAAEVGHQAGRDDVICFDMGGTTAKAGLVRDGTPRVTSDFHVGGSTSGGAHGGGGWPIRVPVIDLAEVGAGGGSIARVDDGGVLRVGPQSAGSSPGPACYGLGGELPTVTDANLVLGYVDPSAFAGGSLAIDVEAAHDAVRVHVAEPLGLDVVDAAAGIHAVVNANMSSAIRVVTIERGIDPRGFTLVASGGAGPAHVVRIAQEFGIDEVLVSANAGVASAIGLLVSEMAVDHVRTLIVARSELDPSRAQAIFDDLERLGVEALAGQGVDPTSVVHRREADLRFVHQAHELTVSVPDGELDDAVLDATEAAFGDQWREQYGMDLADPTQFVNFRVRSSLPAEPLTLRAGDAETHDRPARPVWFAETGGYVDAPLVKRTSLTSGSRLDGPAVLSDDGSATVIPPGCSGTVDSYGNLRIVVGSTKERS